MSKTPNKDKISTNIQYSHSDGSISADISILYRSSELSIEDIEYEHQTYHIYARSSLSYGVCPYCGSISVRIHSHYLRTIADLSMLGHPVVITFEARKFFCVNRKCSKVTFAEQPGDEIFRYRRRTRRCEAVVTQHSLNLSSLVAQKMLFGIGIRISSDTILRDIHRMTIPKCTGVKRVGVDDWAYRKGCTYGSIIVDMDIGAVIDLLGDRSQDGFRMWLESHTAVDMVSRDRSTDYSAAIASTGKEITEVADRFHLIKNISDRITKIIGANYGDYRSSVRIGEEKEDTGKISLRSTMFNEVKELQASGKKTNQIADTLGIARQTVRKYMKCESLPARASSERYPYYLYDSFVEKEYSCGKDLSKVYHTIKEKGFKGSRTPFYEHYRYLSDGHKGCRPKEQVMKMKKSPGKEREPLLPIRQISYIVDKSIRKKKMEQVEVSLIDKMMSFGWFKETYYAASSFYDIINGDILERLDEWLDKYSNSAIAELRSFSYGIKMDINAVRNAIALNVSNGIVEGYVNKLKAVKRVMYGRAKIELLKRKMVFANYAFN